MHTSKSKAFFNAAFFLLLTIFCAFLLLVPKAFAADTVIFLTDPSITTWVVPSDWNSSANTIEAIGGGGSGDSGGDEYGGGGGGYGKIINFSATPGASITVQIADFTAGANIGSGTNGGDTCFSSCAVLKGGGGGGGTGAAPGAGGVGVGDVTYTGGAGGPTTSTPDGSGGGGAAGPNGNGLVGSGDSGNGGAGDNGNGGAGGVGFTGAAGSSGTGWVQTSNSATAGSGGGGGSGSLGVNGGNGGNYGGGGGGGLVVGGGGAPGIIVITYTPVVAPTVTVQDASSVAATSVTGNGSITATGGASVTTRGFAYGTTIAYGATTTDSGSYSTGAYASAITNLTCETTYNYKAYATNSIGTSYSANTTFTTAACPVRMSTGLPWCSSPSAPGWNVNLPGGGCSAPVASASVVALAPVEATEQGEEKKCARYLFTRTLRLGDTGEDVQALQKFLNCQGFLLSTSGAGSPGNESRYFGHKTLAMVKEFQQTYFSEILSPLGLTQATGIFGTASQKKASALMVDE